MNISHFLKSPKMFVYGFLIATSRLWPDKIYIRLYYYLVSKKWLNLKCPKTFNEKLNWLKLYYHNPRFNDLADKYKVKKEVASIIGENYVVPNYGIWDRFEDIDFEKLPDKFVLKSTHDSGGVVICNGKSTFNKEKAKAKFDHDLKTTYSYRTREWVYKDVDHKIIADMLLDDNSGHELTDYKFWCFNGEPKIMYITNKGSRIYENFYDMDFHPVDINHGYPRKEPEYNKPQNFDLMRELSEKLSKDIPFVRIDFFNIKGKIYFGEFTFYDWAGLQPFSDSKWDTILGSWIDLPEPMI